MKINKSFFNTVLAEIMLGIILTACNQVTTHRNVVNNFYLNWKNQGYIATTMITNEQVDQKIGTAYNPLNKEDKYDVYSIKNEKEKIVMKDTSGYYLLEPRNFKWKNDEYTIGEQLEINPINPEVKKKIKTIGYIILLGKEHQICQVEVNKTQVIAIELDHLFFKIKIAEIKS